MSPSRVMADIGSHWCDMAEHVAGERIGSLCADLQIFHAFTASQVSAGRKNCLSIEIYGTRASVAWNQERPDELWIGQRNTNNQIVVKDPSLLKPGARSFADYPGGHSEGYDDTFKQVFRRFYQSIEDGSVPVEYPQFSDGLRQLLILESEIESNRKHAWVDVPRE